MCTYYSYLFVGRIDVAISVRGDLLHALGEVEVFRCAHRFQ